MKELTAERMVRLRTINDELNKYTWSHTDANWRPGLVDVHVYDYLNSMHETDMSDMEPEYLWRKSPDEIMVEILDSGKVFDIEWGAQDLWEYLREWVVEKDYVVHCDDLEEDEYQQLMERE